MFDDDDADISSFVVDGMQKLKEKKSDCVRRRIYPSSVYTLNGLAYETGNKELSDLSGSKKIPVIWDTPMPSSQKD